MQQAKLFLLISLYKKINIKNKKKEKGGLRLNMPNPFIYLYPSFELLITEAAFNSLITKGPVETIP